MQTKSYLSTKQKHKHKSNEPFITQSTQTQRDPLLISDHRKFFGTHFDIKEQPKRQ
jgi:hypothetical protein